MSEFPTTARRTVDTASFWQAVGLRAVGTAIVTAQADEGPRGFLALSPTHLCAEPPLMLVSVDKKTSALDTILKAGHFAINYLEVSQGDVVEPFKGKSKVTGADRFVARQWTILATGAPVLLGAAGTIDCRLEEMIERHGTMIVIGQVCDFIEATAARPMISYKGRTLST